MLPREAFALLGLAEGGVSAEDVRRAYKKCGRACIPIASILELRSSCIVHACYTENLSEITPQFVQPTLSYRVLQRAHPDKGGSEHAFLQVKMGASVSENVLGCPDQVENPVD